MQEAESAGEGKEEALLVLGYFTILIFPRREDKFKKNVGLGWGSLNCGRVERVFRCGESE